MCASEIFNMLYLIARFEAIVSKSCSPLKIITLGTKAYLNTLRFTSWSFAQSTYKDLIFSLCCQKAAFKSASIRQNNFSYASSSAAQSSLISSVSFAFLKRASIVFLSQVHTTVKLGKPQVEHAQFKNCIKFFDTMPSVESKIYVLVPPF